MCYNLRAANVVYVPRRLQEANAAGYAARISGSPMNNSVSMSELWPLWLQLFTASFRWVDCCHGFCPH
ncbi:hypothetical protein CUMW_058210 [Citrus unshiu]|nr:hypothetical protein CUMW_058210 [Citrus unshiu]